MASSWSRPYPPALEGKALELSVGIPADKRRGFLKKIEKGLLEPLQQLSILWVVAANQGRTGAPSGRPTSRRS